jgi:serine/threonine-protein kinase
VEPKLVHFRVSTDPLGAHVMFDGKDIGKTPLEFDLPQDAQGLGSANLDFVLEGYAKASTHAAGAPPEVIVEQTLHKVETGKDHHPKTNLTPGYKDDPYR